LRTLGFLVLALQDQSTAVNLPEPGTTTDTDVVSLILNASPLVWVVLVVLLFFSAVSWGIILYKQRQLARAAQQTLQFLDVFRKSSRFSEVQAACGGLTASPLVGLFQSGYAELNAQLRGPGENRPVNPSGRPTLRSLDAVDRALLRATTTELAKLEHRVSFLATTASLTPYIDIGASGSTSLGTVAPGIAEALVATALGLFAAIPAVYFYNDITSRVKAFANQMEDFSMEFLTIAERNFT